MKVRVTLALLALILMLVSLPAMADPVAITNVSSPVHSFISGFGTVGWTFNTSQDVWVTSLGTYATSGTAGYVGEKPIGIWNTSTGDLLATTYTPSSITVDSYNFNPISPILLMAGTNYTIGVSDIIAVSGGGVNSYYCIFPDSSDVTFDPTISFTGNVYDTYFNSSQIFAQPTTPIIVSTSQILAQPNFEFTPVPEPGTFLLLSCGLISLVVLRKKQVP